MPHGEGDLKPFPCFELTTSLLLLPLSTGCTDSMTDKAGAVALVIDTSRQRSRRLQTAAVPSASTSVQTTPGTAESYLDLAYTPSTACTNLSVASGPVAKTDSQWIISQIDEYLARFDVSTFDTTELRRRSARLRIETDATRLSVVERTLASSPDALDPSPFLAPPDASPDLLSPFFRGFTLGTGGMQDAAPFPYSPCSALDGSWSGNVYRRPSMPLEMTTDSDSGSSASYRTTPESTAPTRPTWFSPVARRHEQLDGGSDQSCLSPVAPVVLARSASTKGLEAEEARSSCGTTALDAPTLLGSQTSLGRTDARLPLASGVQRSNTMMEIRPGSRAMLGSHKPRGRRAQVGSAKDRSGTAARACSDHRFQ